jgi:hypothetical protein
MGAVPVAAGEPAAEIGGDRLVQVLGTFVRDAQQHDDVSLMVLRRVKIASEPTGSDAWFCPALSEVIVD